MCVLNDDILAGGASLQMPVQEDSFIILLPVAGAVNYKDSNGHISCIAAGQVQLVTVYSGDAIEISNREACVAGPDRVMPGARDGGVRRGAAPGAGRITDAGAARLAARRTRTRRCAADSRTR